MDNQYIYFGMIKTVAAKIEMLHEAANSHIHKMINDPEHINLVQKMSDVLSSNKDELKKRKKALGKPPRLSRSKNPVKREQNTADRDAYFERKAKLDDEIRSINERQKQLRNPGSFKDLVIHFSATFNSMCKADYQVTDEGNKFLPTYHDTYDQLKSAIKHCAYLDKEFYDEWNKAVKRVGLHEYSEDDVKMALAYLAASKRAQQFPHNLSIEQVFDGFGNEPWEYQLAKIIVENQLVSKRQEAINCTRLNQFDHIDIEHVSTLIDEALPSIRGSSPKSNFYLSTPMGGVYNAEVNGQTYNSGSKTDGVLLPAIEAGLNYGHYVTVIVHRITLTHDIYNRVESYINTQLPSLKNKVWHYETKVSLFNPRVLVVCVNSMTRPDIAEFVSKSNVVIVDEFTQVIDNIPNLLEGKGSVIEVQKALATFDILMEQIADQNTTFIALDADMESKSIQLIDRYTNTESNSAVYNISHPERVLPLAQRSKQVIFHRDRKNIEQLKALLQSWTNEIHEKSAKNSRFFIAVDSKNQSTALAEHCRQQGLIVCLINSDTTQANDDFGAYGLMRHSCKPEYFDVVIFSPSITSGVSWVSPHFKRGIVIANKTIASGNLKQMLFRFRNTTLVHVFAQMTLTGEPIPEDKSNKALIISLANQAEYGPLYIEMREHRSEVNFQSTKNQRCYLAHQLEAEGWGYSTCDPTLQPNSEAQSYPSIKSKVRTDTIMGSPLPTMRQYKHITSQRNKSNKTEEIYAAIHFQSALYGAVSDTVCDIRLWVSGAAERATCAIQTHLLAKDKTLALQMLNTCLTQCGFPDWRKLLEDGEDINVLSADCLQFFLGNLENPLIVGALHALGIFDNDKESNRKRWIRKNGAPIKETAVVISHAKAEYSSVDSLLNDISKKLSFQYKAIQLIDGNVLVINTEPKNSAFGGAMIRKLLALCGIPAQSNDRATLVDGKKAQSLIIIAKRRFICHKITTCIVETLGVVQCIHVKCITDAVGFDVKIYWNGEAHIVATPEIIERVTELEKLARSGCVVSFSEVWGSKPALPHLHMGCSGNEALNWQEVHLTPQKQQLENGDAVYNEYPLSILDYVRLILPSLLANTGIVESMLHNLDLQVITRN
ncbi:TPA: hypothetical protein ACVO0O_002862 [Vibrio alginolyticus]